MKKFILVVPYFYENKFSVNKAYLKSLQSSPVPYYISDYNKKNIYIDFLAGIILTGGGDISSEFLNQTLHEKASDICFERDDFEIFLLKQAYLYNIPVLGICRGAQIMNVAFGGNINQHIEGHLQSKQRNLYHHSIALNKASNLYSIINKEKIKVNSIHHQCISTIPKNFSISALSNDNIIEAIEKIDEKHFFLGLQWHPEALNDFYSKKIFETFLKKVYNFVNIN